jgi:DNA polymerase I-like protein with 3'-5' exonuclease and polymerase domains
MFVVDPVVARPEADEPPNTTTPVPGNQLKFLTELCQKHGIPVSKGAIVRACPPVLADTWNSDKQIGDWIKLHRQEFVDNVSKTKPKVIVAMGKSSARQVYNKSIKIMNIRGTPVPNEEFNCLVLPTVGLGHAIRIPEVQPLLDVDMATLSSMRDAGYTLDYQVTKNYNYRWTTDLGFLLKKAQKGPLHLTVDTEGTGLRYYSKDFKILTVQLCWNEGEAVAVPVDYDPLYMGARDPQLRYDRPLNNIVRGRCVKQLRKLLTHPNVYCTGQNFKFDILALRHALGIEVANWEDDTICLAHGVDENILNKGLDELTRRFAPEMAGYADNFNRDAVHIGKTRMDLVHPDDMLSYGCGDSDACWRVKANLEAKLKQDKKAYRCYKLVVMPALRAFARIEDHGFNIDRKALKAFEKMLRAHQKKEYWRIRAMVPDSIRRLELFSGPGEQGCGQKYEKWDKRDRKNPKKLKEASITRPGFLRAMLFTHPDGLQLTPVVFTKSTKAKRNPADRVPSTSGKNHLAYFEEDHPFIKPIMEYIQNEKLLGTYVGSDGEDDEDGGGTITGFYKYLVDNRIRPTYLLHRTVTGRSASADPNGQNFPKRGPLAKKYREIFVAPPGYVLLEVDFSQIELRIAAIMAQDPTMLELYRKGADIHAATAAAVMGISLEEFNNLPKDVRSLKRFQAKAVNFGFLYGMGWRKFITYARTEYKITFTEEEAQAIRNTFFRLYRRLKPWHNAMRGYAEEHGQVRAFSGRVRHLPSVYSPDETIKEMAMRQAINSPVQAMGSDLGLCAIAMLVNSVPFDVVRPIGFIHDALVCIAPEEHAVEAAQTIKRVMENIPTKTLFNWTPPIPIIAEASVGKTLAKMIEVKDDWYDDDNVINWRDLQRVDWEARCKVAKAKGEKLPDRPWAPRLPKLVKFKPLAHRRKLTILKPAAKPLRIRAPRKIGA